MNRAHHIMHIHEATALGAALLGGLAAGLYRDAADVKSTVELQSTTIEPDPEAAAFYESFYQSVYLQIYGALKPLNHAIYDLVVDQSLDAAEPHGA